MRFSAVLLVISTSMTLSDSVPIKTLVFPTASSNSYVELTPLKPLQLQAFTLCMRVATELTGKREVILFAYRTNNGDELNVWREADGRLSLYLSSSEAALFRVPELGALQTHLCITWDSSTGAAALFMNGRRSLTKIYRKGHTVRQGGRVILGQDADDFLGSFDSGQSFVGEISDVNMWDSVLSDRTVRAWACGRKGERGNIFNWDTAEFETTGRVEIINREV